MLWKTGKIIDHSKLRGESILSHYQVNISAAYHAARGIYSLIFNMDQYEALTIIAKQATGLAVMWYCLRHVEKYTPEKRQKCLLV